MGLMVAGYSQAYIKRQLGSTSGCNRGIVSLCGSTLGLLRSPEPFQDACSQVVKPLRALLGLIYILKKRGFKV